MRIRYAASVATAASVAMLALVLSVAASLALGSRHIALSVVCDALVSGGTSHDAQVVVSLRVPRTLAALLGGGALGLAGSVMQAITRNPLADPGVLGINAGAAFAVVATTATFGVTSSGVNLAASVGGAAAASLLVFVLSGRGATGSRARLALAGIAVSAALTSVTQAIVSSNRLAFNEFRFWVSGSLEGVDMTSVVRAGCLIGAGGVVALLLSSALGILSLGDEAAMSLGVRVRVARSLAVVSVTALAAGATALAGPLAFVGLAVPLLVRRVVGARQRAIAGWSILVGAVWVCLADVASRLILAPSEAPVGVIVALVGAPFFIARASGRGMS